METGSFTAKSEENGKMTELLRSRPNYHRRPKNLIKK